MEGLLLECNTVGRSRRSHQGDLDFLLRNMQIVQCGMDRPPMILPYVF